MTDADLNDAREAIREQRGEIREYLDGEGVDVSNWVRTRTRLFRTLIGTPLTLTNWFLFGVS